MRLWAPLAPALLALTLATPAFALPGEAAAVLQHCGAPKAEEQMTSPVTNRLERNLYYGNDTIMHFQPSENGWSFTTGWMGHIPVTRDMLAARMPCFRDAMQQAATAPLPYVDPSVAVQTSLQPVDEATFGIAHFWLIAGLALLLLVLVLVIPSARRKSSYSRTADILRRRVLRKPSLLNQRPIVRRHLTEVE